MIDKTKESKVYSVVRKSIFKDKKFPSDEHKMIAHLQSELLCLGSIDGWFVIEGWKKDIDFPYYLTPTNNMFWINGIDNKEYINDAFSLYQNKSEAEEIIVHLNSNSNRNFDFFKLGTVRQIDSEVIFESVLEIKTI